MPKTADDLIQSLGLTPHPEGGFYRETFRAALLPAELPGRGARAACTAIYFLLRRGDFSAFHRVASDEIWHHYQGSPVELHLLDEAGPRQVLLGSGFEAGEEPQRVVPAGVLQAARVTTGDFALVGCTVAPGFDFADFAMPPRGELLNRHPEHARLITALTR